MNEEEKQAIEILNIAIGKRKGVHVYQNELTKAIKKVLNLLEKKDKEIQFQKEINKTEQNRHKQTEKSLKGQLKKKDKMIDLMAEDIAFSKEINSYEDIKTYKKQIKQYFERKVENGN